MIKVKYYYSACVGITTPDVSILCDPWFTDGIYEGAWYQYPKYENPLERIGSYDLIYISHIHPDHYDVNFLKQYLILNPETKIIANEKFLVNAIKREGLPLIEYTSDGYIFGNTMIGIFLNDSESASDIDTALAVKYTDGELPRKWHSVINMNDNIPNENQLKAIKRFFKIHEYNPIAEMPEIIEYEIRPDIALLGYAGASSYPQTYYTDESLLTGLAKKKKEKCFARYKELDKALNARINIPFAGQYILGGKLAHLNKYRGVPDAVEVYDFDDKAAVLKENAEISTISIKEEIQKKIRLAPYSNVAMDNYIQKISKNILDYEAMNIDLDKVNFPRLLRKAYERAMSSNEYQGGDYYIIINFNKKYFVCNINNCAEKSNVYDDFKEIQLNGASYSLIIIDERYLLGLLIGLYHWNNAEVGSHYQTRREPDIYNRDVQRFLNFFYV